MNRIVGFALAGMMTLMSGSAFADRFERREPQRIERIERMEHQGRLHKMLHRERGQKMAIRDRHHLERQDNRLSRRIARESRR